MKRIFSTILAVLVATSIGLSVQPSTGSTLQTENSNANTTKKKRGPVFRASKDQIKQAQALLKTRGLYSGTETGKLDPDTRASLKKYQEAESLKVTGTLNKVTLEKMGIVLTDKQKTM
ncbi:MAG TPA: peptidoglycan-binding domain-containing protein [Pyrinomonadaceae bacterium]|nr:peptidoglycan-binding domain-containing protein [Pyrinomonadaceae bacterium]